MSKKKKGKDRFVVYSTNPDYDYSQHQDDQETPAPGEQTLYVSIDRKQRKGKAVTLVEEFIGSEEDMKDLGKYLKRQCGVGGSVKDGVILIQGEFKDKVYDLLLKKNYKVKKKG